MKQDYRCGLFVQSSTLSFLSPLEPVNLFLLRQQFGVQ